MAGSRLLPTLAALRREQCGGILLPINYHLVILSIFINLLSLNIFIYKVEAIMVPIAYGSWKD